jgi:hypothetical protein
MPFQRFKAFSESSGSMEADTLLSGLPIFALSAYAYDPPRYNPTFSDRIAHALAWSTGKPPRGVGGGRAEIRILGPQN